MKKLMALLVIALMTNFTFAQNIEPKFEKEDQLVKATYYYDNGNVKMVGYFNGEKLDGKWISYNELGKTETVAYYRNGEKVGTWLFSDKNDVKQVVFRDNKVAEVKDLDNLDLAIF